MVLCPPPQKKIMCQITIKITINCTHAQIIKQKRHFSGVVTAARPFFSSRAPFFSQFFALFFRAFLRPLGRPHAHARARARARLSPNKPAISGQKLAIFSTKCPFILNRGHSVKTDLGEPTFNFFAAGCFPVGLSSPTL